MSSALAQQGPTRATPVPRDELVRRLDSLSRAFLIEAPSAGATVAVIQRGDTLLLEGVGERDTKHHVPAQAGTVYRLGSITKQFTSSAIMQLAEQGRIALTDPVTKFLPQYPQWKAVTIRQLLNHTSGIHSYTSSEEWAKHWSEDMTPGAIVDFVTRDTLDFAPGSRWRYNNTGYMLLGMVLEKVTGTPYAEYVSQHLFAPLGMRQSAYCPSRPTDPAYAVGYELRDGKLVVARSLSMTQPYAAGALCMSVPDFLHWQSALTSGRVVSRASFTLMSSSDTVSSGLKTGYGFGLVSGRIGTHALIGHGGAVNGFSTESAWLPDDSLQVVVFSNTGGSSPEILAYNLASAVLGLPLRPKPKLPPAVPLAVAEMQKYVGVYDLITPSGLPFTIHVSVDGDRLIAQAEGPGQGRIPLTYLGADTFGAAFDATLRLTFTIVNGTATKAHLEQRGSTLEGAKRP